MRTKSWRTIFKNGRVNIAHSFKPGSNIDIFKQRKADVSSSLSTKRKNAGAMWAGAIRRYRFMILLSLRNNVSDTMTENKGAHLGTLLVHEECLAMWPSMTSSLMGLWTTKTVWVHLKNSILALCHCIWTWLEWLLRTNRLFIYTAHCLPIHFWVERDGWLKIEIRFWFSLVGKRGVVDTENVEHEIHMLRLCHIMECNCCCTSHIPEMVLV